MPELFASLFFVISLILLVRSYHGRGIGELNLPYSLTLNGLIALISTVNGVALMFPVGSTLSQRNMALVLWNEEIIPITRKSPSTGVKNGAGKSV